MYIWKFVHGVWISLSMHKSSIERVWNRQRPFARTREKIHFPKPHLRDSERWCLGSRWNHINNPRSTTKMSLFCLFPRRLRVQRRRWCCKAQRLRQSPTTVEKDKIEADFDWSWKVNLLGNKTAGTGQTIIDCKLHRSGCLTVVLVLDLLRKIYQDLSRGVVAVSSLSYASKRWKFAGMSNTNCRSMDPKKRQEEGINHRKIVKRMRNELVMSQCLIFL